MQLKYIFEMTPYESECNSRFINRSKKQISLLNFRTHNDCSSISLSFNTALCTGGEITKILGLSVS